MQLSLGTRLFNALTVCIGAGGVIWSGPESRIYFEWIFYLSVVWAVVTVFREGWSHRVQLCRRLKLIEPSHVIILGLVIAIGGVIWLMRAGTQPTPDPILVVKALRITALCVFHAPIPPLTPHN